MRQWRDPDQWSFEQRAALKGEYEQQLEETLERAERLSQQLAADVIVAGYLLGRRRRMQLEDEDQLPF